MSVNIEIPKEESLKALAPEKNHQSIFLPMKQIQQGVLENKEDRNELHPERLRPMLLSKAQQKRVAAEQQLMLDFGD